MARASWISSGAVIPTYDQATVSQFAKIYTGWTYPTQAGATLKIHNPAYYVGPMVVFASNHDTTSKTLLNGTGHTGVGRTWRSRT